MKKKRVRIPVGQAETVTGALAVPEPWKENRAGIIVAHGAGNDMENPLLVAFADGLAQAGYPTLRFNFLYKEKGKKAPDRLEVLERVWLSAHAFFKGQLGFATGQIIGAGKSMGGRIASQLVAEGRLPVDRLIFLGYPLHPPGKKDKLRDVHLYRIQIPMLFFSGTRDSLCDLEKLNTVLGKVDTSWTLDVIEGGDHSFKTLKSSGLNPETVFEHIIQKSIAWIDTELKKD
jgi:predicted alpha/beta-hydrolase family hydrolase